MRLQLGLCPSGNSCPHFWRLWMLRLVNISRFISNSQSVFFSFFQHFMCLIWEVAIDVIANAAGLKVIYIILFLFFQSQQIFSQCDFFCSYQNLENASQHSFAPQVKTLANTAFPHVIPSYYKTCNHGNVLLPYVVWELPFLSFEFEFEFT